MFQKLKRLWSKVPHYSKYIFLLFIFSRIALMIVGAIAHIFLKDHNGDDHFLSNVPWLHMWYAWDSLWYTKIAEHGYTFPEPFNPDEFSTLGFFPLYGYLMRGVFLIIHNTDLAGVLVSNIFFLIGAHFFYKIARLNFDEKTSLRAVLFLFAFPTAFIFSGIYAESLFLCLSVMSIYYARTKRWWAAGLAAAFLLLTKAFGLLIVIPLVLTYLKQIEWQFSRIRWNVLSIGLPFLSLGLYFLYCYHLTGDALSYVHVQSGAWGHYTQFPFANIWLSLTGESSSNFFSAFFVTIALIFIFVSFFTTKVPTSYILYSIASLLFPAYSGILVGSLRYMSFNFPVMLALADSTHTEGKRDAVLFPLIVLQGALFVFWTVGTYWFIA